MVFFLVFNIFYDIITFLSANCAPQLSAPFSANCRDWWQRQQTRRCCTSASAALWLHPPVMLGAVAKSTVAGQADRRRNCQHITLQQLWEDHRQRTDNSLRSVASH